jgi:hypothetical protein
MGSPVAAGAEASVPAAAVVSVPAAAVVSGVSLSPPPHAARAKAPKASIITNASNISPLFLIAALLDPI